MDRDESTHYVPSRTSLWCPICGASEGQSCMPVKGSHKLRYASHNAYATGQVPRQQVYSPEGGYPHNAPVQRIVGDRPKWTSNRWVQ